MDWDDLEPKATKVITVGEKLTDLSIAELDERVEALKAEIVRVEAEAKAKKTQSDAAAKLFKS